MIQVGLLYYFSSILILLEWKKWRYKLKGLILPTDPRLVNRDLKPSGINLRYKMVFFGGLNFVDESSHLYVLLYP